MLNTAFQATYLRRILQMPLTHLTFLGEPSNLPPINQIVFAVTSANQQYSRYNPIPFYVRAIGVDRFARPLETAFAIQYRIIGVPHFAPTPRFAEFVLKEIAQQTEGNLQLTPENCVVLCSTTAVIKQYQQLGFAILPAELNTNAPTPIDLIKQTVQVGESWSTDVTLRETLSPASFDLWQDFPDIPRRILRLWRDPLLNDSGSLTEDRNYNSYAHGMSHPAVMQLKYNDVKGAIQAGKIVDEGCADGALLEWVARDFPDSDLIGIEITGEFMARCHERQRAGVFGGTYVHFHQRNITHPLFEPNTINTTLCNSTVHELWSYGDGEATVHDYFAKKFAQTVSGGHLIIRDVVGPEEKNKPVYMWLNEEDGLNDNIFAHCATRAELQAHLNGLSTNGRFLRFARDFHPLPIEFEKVTINQTNYIKLTLESACEFISKKDYTDNWDSEMHEAFAFWSFSQWKQALHKAGFTIVENPNQPQSGSRVYTNEWIVKNRYKGKVTLLQMTNNQLTPLAYPPTNIILVGRKP